MASVLKAEKKGGRGVSPPKSNLDSEQQILQRQSPHTNTKASFVGEPQYPTSGTATLPATVKFTLRGYLVLANI